MVLQLLSNRLRGSVIRNLREQLPEFSVSYRAFVAILGTLIIDIWDKNFRLSGSRIVSAAKLAKNAR